MYLFKDPRGIRFVMRAVATLFPVTVNQFVLSKHRIKEKQSVSFGVFIYI